jgi:hypothetical protein
MAIISPKHTIEDTVRWEKLTFDVSEAFLKTCGANSLTGAIGKAVESNLLDLGKITLRFPQSSRRQLEEKGVHEMLIQEHTIHTFLDDILWLQEQGIEVKIETYTVDKW